MKSKIHRFSICMMLMVLAGCQSIPKNPDLHTKESNKEILTAVGQVADALAGQELTEDQKKKFTRDIQKDKDAQSALRSIAGAMDAKKAVVKYCPLDGKRYSVDLQMCPVHHVKLEELVD